MHDLEIGLCRGTLAQADLPRLIDAAGRHGLPTSSILLILPFMVDNLCVGGPSAAAQRLLAPDIHATATAIMGMVTLLFGPGLGVTLVGMVSDFLRMDISANGSAQDSLR